MAAQLEADSVLAAVTGKEDAAKLYHQYEKEEVGF